MRNAIHKLCVFRMDGRVRRAGLGPGSRKQPESICKGLKYHDSDALLFGLVWSCLVLFGEICA